MKLLKRILKWLGIGILGFVLISLLALIVMRGVWAYQLTSEIRAIQTKGKPFTPEEVIGPKLPDAENAAVIYCRALAVISGEEDKKALVCLSSFLSPEKRAKNPSSWDEARKVVSRYQRAIRLTDTASSYPKCQFKTELNPFANSRQQTQLRHLTRLLCAKATLDARNGRMDQSVNSIDTAFKVSNALKDEPDLISHVLRVAIIRIASRSLLSCLQYGDLTEQQAERLFNTLKTINVNSGFLRAFEGERTLWLYHVSKYRYSMVYMPEMKNVDIRYINLYAPLSEQLNLSFPQKMVYRVLRDMYGRTGFMGDQLSWMRFTNQLMLSTRMSYRQARLKGLVSKDISFPFYAVTTKHMSPTHISANSVRYASSVEVSAYQILLALQAYKARYGMYPKTLNELKSKLGWKLPTDTYSDQDFLYRRQGNGFILYSVGPNMKDDGGVQKERINRTKETGDFVWTMDH